MYGKIGATHLILFVLITPTSPPLLQAAVSQARAEAQAAEQAVQRAGAEVAQAEVQAEASEQAAQGAGTKPPAQPPATPSAVLQVEGAVSLATCCVAGPVKDGCGILNAPTHGSQTCSVGILSFYLFIT